MATVMQHHYNGPPREYYTGAQRPPSPPTELNKCSLPPISSLLGLADAGSPVNETSPVSHRPSPRLEASFRHQPVAKADSRPGSGYGKQMTQRGLPPSPPMSTDVSLDNPSPSTKSVSQFSSVSTPSRYYYETTPPLEPDHQRHRLPNGQGASRPTPTQQPGPAPPGSYFPSTGPPPPASQPQASSMMYQRPLPQTFPPMSVPMSMTPSSEAISWQHHHYLNPSSGQLFPQSQDRYICQTCNKAFSRPSSLRIHSHSHTGEKPFKCSQAGCGKAFSVRSNMKRHERGCHSIEVTAGPVL
jgi:uncharacterized Zn-finger protein